MQRSPYLIVKEFCDSESGQLRMNAATALATIADTESLDELVRMGLNEASPEVRDHIQREIAQLPLPLRSTAFEALAANAEQPGAEGRKAYRLLGEMRSRGSEMPRLRLPALRRLALAKSLHQVVYPARRTQDRMRGTVRSLAGTLAAATIIGLIQTVNFHQAGSGISDLYGYFALSALTAIIVAVLSMQFSSPIALHADRQAMAFLDLLTVAGASLLAAAVIVPIFSSFSEAGARADLAAVLMLPTLAIATRLAMLASLGAFRSRAMNLWLAIFCGASAGTLAMSFIPAAFGIASSRGVSNLWYMLLPIATGLAAAWAQQDASAPGKFKLPAALRIAGAIPALAMLGVMVMVIVPWRSPASLDAFPMVVVDTSGQTSRTFSIHVLPAHLHLGLANPGKISGSLTSQLESALWTIDVLRGPAVRVSTADKPVAFELPNLTAGDKQIDISRDTDGPPLLTLVPQKLGSLFHVPPVLATITLEFGPPSTEPAPLRPFAPPRPAQKKQ